MARKNELLPSILNTRCPRCREASMFKYPLHRFIKFSQMHKHCPNCGMRFEVEPGFFIGAMYVSYAMSVGLVFIVGLLVYTVFNDPSLWVYLVSVGVMLVALLPVLFRYSRVLYLYWFGGVSYNEKKQLPKHQ